jgi:DNA polymerase-1
VTHAWLTRVLRLRRSWAIDFEYSAGSGDRPSIICMVAKCALTGISLRLWGDDLHHCPFDCGDDELFIAYYASAEASCFDVLGWPRPRRMLDLFAEFRCLTNGAGTQHGASLIGALLHFGLPTIGAEEKTAMRDLAIRGGPFSEEERHQLLDYCESDVDALLLLLPRILQAHDYTRDDLGRALLRGRYMTAAAAVENHGVPIDVSLLNRLQRHWEDIKLHLVKAVDADYGVYNGQSFVAARFEAYLTRRGIPWPLLESGALALDDDTFRQQARIHPEIGPLRDVRHAMGQLRLHDLAVGKDGRNRTLLSAFRAKTGRNQPSNSKSIFGASMWLRSLIRPAEGRAIAYIDWSAQEIAIAGALSGDARLWEAYASGDPYLAFAQQAGLAPPGATKASHGHERQACKVIVLGIGYGMSAEGMTRQSGLHVVEARKLLRLHRETYPVFWNWVDDNVNRALLGMTLRTTFGWRICFPPGCGKGINPRSMLNWPMQANGAEMMRLGVAMAIEAGLMICAPIHDALLLEAPVGEIEVQSARLVQIMGAASEHVLGSGKRCRCDVEIVRYPDRYQDERGTRMFRKVMAILAEVERQTAAMPTPSPPDFEYPYPLELGGP